MFKRIKVRAFFAFSLLLLFSSFVGAESLQTQKLGGEGSVRTESIDAFSFPVRNILSAHRKDFMVGKSFFRQNWVSFPSSVRSLEGLGPLFVAQSCVACHDRDGRGNPYEDKGASDFWALLFRLSRPASDKEIAAAHGGPVGVRGYGEQLQNFSLPGVPREGRPVVTWTEVRGSFADGESYTLIKPQFSIQDLAYGSFPKGVMISPRVTPGVFGVGLLEAISEEDILARSDPEDVDKDGISGRPNWVWDHQKKKKALGRFGWKANQPHILQQTATAFFEDMGITSPFFLKQNCEPEQKECLASAEKKQPEISREDLEKVSLYTHLLTVPQTRHLKLSQIEAGRQLLQQVSCTKCHVERFRTSKKAEFAENRDQEIFPYTDLLLHDMGPELADGRPDFEATGSEWRTPPLWGIGLIQKINKHSRFLHDGRARSIEEAILWHGGEAERSREQYKALLKKDRQIILTYLESL